MRLLFFLVSFLFSIIFYSFHQLSLGKDIYGTTHTYPLKLESIGGSLFYDSLIFFFLGIFFIIIFSPQVFSSKNNTLDRNYQYFWFIFIAFVIFPYFYKDSFVFSAIVFFIFGELCFSYISELQTFNKQKLSIKYFGLILNFTSIFVSAYYIFNIQFSFYLLAILFYSMIFNYFLHKKYTNIISLAISIIIFIFLLYFFIIKLYGFVINIL